MRKSENPGEFSTVDGRSTEEVEGRLGAFSGFVAPAVFAWGGEGRPLWEERSQSVLRCITPRAHEEHRSTTNTLACAKSVLL